MRKFKQYMMKGLAFLLLAGMVQITLCSALCASGVYSCCKEKSCCHKSCCDKKNKTKSANNNCQREHFAFFKTVGQFHSFYVVSIEKVFQPLTIPIEQENIFQSASNAHFIVSYNNYHPPRSGDDIRILISAFRI